MEREKELRGARKNAYQLLHARPRSEHEMRSRLKLKRHCDSIVDEVIEGLRKAGEIDDTKFAAFWIESRMHVNPAGYAALKRELQEKGVPEAVIESAIEDKAGTHDEYEVALNIAGQRLRRLVKIDRRKALKRLYDFLVRRGFDRDVVSRVIESVTNEDG